MLEDSPGRVPNVLGSLPGTFSFTVMIDIKAVDIG
jgi:hypothetical protein